ncbi:MAG: chromosome segregation protein SMC [Deltaproteobacteria bacterium]|nr:chromosome segregation protein SMC [Candidatus Anaeroferrophillus wilburensis]MBN2890015.1 chromosome segregation protein SMC [Deltaproteobacteria bacterium]
MKVKELTIQGFKSFVHRTRIPLHAGITVVVGPNGCGKSNILDALRWVMGEQRPLQLRGKAMGDMVFNGTNRLKPAGLAEVHLTMTGRGQPLPPPYEQYAELMISRRMFRQGDSEYFLAKVPCRLKDVAALFRDTGIGAKGYAFIEQGQISHIITAKPTEIRFMFEEAAGVSNFQIQRQESYRKIRESEENLDRLHDIIHEVAKNLKNLQKQARQAKKYRRLQEDEKTLDQQLYVYRYRQVEDDLGPLREEVRRWQREVEAKEQERSSVGAELDNLTAKGRQLTLQLDETREQLSSRKEELVAAHSRITFLLQEQETVRRRLKEASDRQQRLQRRKTELQKTAGEHAGLLSEVVARLQKHNEERQSCEEAYETEKQTVARLASEQAAAREELFQLMTRESRTKNEQLLNQEKIKHLKQRRSQLEDISQQASGELAARRLLVEKLEKELAEQQANQQQLQRQKEQLTADLATQKEKYGKAEQERQNVADRLTACDRQWHQLHIKVSEGFGFTEGMKEALRAESGDRILHSFWDVFAEVPTEWEQPLELFIRQLCEGLVIADQSVVHAFIGRQRQRDRVAVLQPRQNLLSVDGCAILSQVIPTLADIVAVKEEFQDVVLPLLKRTYAVADGDAALALLDELPVDSYVLSKTGEIYAGNGWFWVGNSKKTSSNELLSLRRQQDEAEQDREIARQQLADQDRVLEDLQAGGAAISAKYHACLQELEPLDEAIRQGKRQLHDSLHEQNRLVTSARHADLEMTQLRVQEADLAEAVAAGSEEIGAAADLRAAQERQLTKLVALHQEGERQMLAAQEMLADKKVILASLNAEQAQVKREIDRFAVEGEQLDRQYAALTRDISADSAKLEGSVAGLNETREGIAALEKVVADHEQRLAGRVREREFLEEKLGSQQAHMRELESLLADWRPRLLDARLALQDSEHRQRQLMDSFVQRYGFSLPDHLRETGVAQQEFKEDEAVAKLKNIRSWIANFGQVNLLALEEEEEVQQRYDFLKEQEADLLSSIQAVREAIEKMEKTSREKFLATFFQVRDHFSQLFSELFDGGRASLNITDEDNLWEAGIEITAAPPGKRMQNLRLFSGGEKALLAIALIFAFFKVNPAPFCVLDEVDAPLDDANIGRFNQLVKKFAAHSQFLIITHNRRTMTIGDFLYGVTMEEDGVSKAVSVQLADYDRTTEQPLPAAEELAG